MKITTLLLFVFIFCLRAEVSNSQNVNVTLKRNNTELENVLNDIEKQTDYLFVYNKSVNVRHKVSVDLEQASIRKTLDKLFDGTEIRYEIDGSYIILSATDKPFGPLASSVTRQGFEISGTVKDESGDPVIGANILVKGTTNGTITDVNGQFSLLDISVGFVLQITYLGYVSQEITITKKENLKIVLAESAQALDEVVVIGYGTVKKSDLTGSLVQVKSDAVNAYPATNVLQALSGRATGVQVMQNSGAPGSSISMRIRGTNSIQGNNEPLYVIDGFPISSNNPTIINNSDIESIEILKDASATAIYGSRGANGVVLITTKRGKTGRTQVDFEASYSIQSIRKKLDLMNAQEYALFYNEQAKNDGSKPYFSDDEVKSLGKGYDWQDLAFKTAPLRTVSIGVNGGSEKTQFSTSLSTFLQDGIVNGKYNRYSLRTNLNHEFNSKIKVSVSSTFTRIDTQSTNSEGGNRGGTLISGAISAPPTLTPYNEDGSYRELNTAYPFISNVLINPVNWLNEYAAKMEANRVLANAAVEYTPIKGLVIKVLGGIENADDRSDNYRTTNFVNSSGSASVSTSRYGSFLNENTVSYNKQIKQHSISAVVGLTYQNFFSKSLSGSGSGFVSDVSETFDLKAAANPGIPNSGYSNSTLISYLARANYNYGNRYLLTASFRSDGSSKFSKGNKWGVFPSGAFAWRISNEEFLKDIPAISDLKLRLGWGVTGSQAVGAYMTLNQLYSDKTVFDETLFTTYAPSSRLPGKLKWETTEQKNIGIDISILNNRLSFTADYYIKNTKDLLNTVQLPPSFGYTTTIRNIGEMQNKGFELGIEARPFTGEFSWLLNANISFNKNKVVKLYGGEDILGGYFDITAITDYSNILREGEPIGRFWGYLEDGYTDKGRVKYKDLDGDKSITTKDKTFIGDPNPDFIYGLNSSMSYKGFELTIFLQGSYGNDIFSLSSINNTVDYGYGLNMLREVYTDHWTAENTNAKYPINSRSSAVKVSDRFVHDGSYLRLKNIQLAYNLTSRQLKTDFIKNIQVYVSGQNLLTFTKYFWWDPEVNSKGGTNSMDQGYDYYTYPTTKSVTFGIRASF